MAEIKKKEIKEFLEVDNSALNTFRTLILFGRNTATYKFAFCNALMQLNPRNEVKYDDLRDGFVQELVNHYKNNTNQFKLGTTKLTEAMDNFLLTSKSQTDWNNLYNIAERSIYNNVFDAFQNVGRGTINKDYLLFEHDRQNKKLILTDNTNSILESNDMKKIITLENQSRWEIVEEAWKAGLSPNVLEYNDDDEVFYSVLNYERVGLRSAVDVLLPYQKGNCFYCNKELDREASSQDDNFPDVDHFLPFALMNRMLPNAINPNGVWNLVIACKECNRGVNGKFDEPPHKQFYHQLKRRNLYFTEEHKHSLKNSILLSLNAETSLQVGLGMDSIYKSFEMLNGWQPEIIYP